MILGILKRDRWPELFALMQQARVSGLPDTLAELEEHLASCFIIARFSPSKDENDFDGRITAAYIVSPGADGIAFLQIIGFDPPVIEWVAKRAFENLDIVCLWSQVPRTNLAACIHAGFQPTGAIDIGNPMVMMTAATLKLLDK